MKKRISAIAGALLATAFTGQTASAKTLEDVLKAKGVVTEEDLKEVKVKPVYDYQPGRGFPFTSRDDKFQLYIGGYLQARYDFLNKEDGAQNVSKFQMRRIKLWVGGYAYTKNLTYLLQQELTAFTSPKLFDHAYVNYKFVDEAQIMVGQSKMPFGRQWLVAAGWLEFVDRAIVSDYFRPGYDIGVKVHGRIASGVVSYQVGGYGGKGQGIPSTDNRNAIAARVTVEPLGALSGWEGDLDTTSKPLFSVGANYFYDRLQKDGEKDRVPTLASNNISVGFLNQVTRANGFANAEKLDVNLAGIDAAFKWRGFHAIGEFLFGKVSGDASGAVVHSRGFLAQGGYCIIPGKLEAAVRYDYVDPNRDIKDDIKQEIGGAVSYYLVKHNLKVQADVSNVYDRASSIDRNNMVYRVQTQIVF